MAKSGMNPKTLQYIMGHSDISVTLNTYSYVHFDDAKEELLRVVQNKQLVQIGFLLMNLPILKGKT